MEIRDLKAKDTKTLIKMLGKLTPSARSEIVNIIKGVGKEKADFESIAIALFQVLASVADDIYAWLADMAGLTIEQLDELPASTPIDIIKEIGKKEGLKSFFGSVAKSVKTAAV